MKNTFSVRPADCRFIVNEESRKVICILENTKLLFVHFIDDNSNIPAKINSIANLFSNTPASHLYQKLMMPDKFVGIATCSADDEWNEEIGRQIAFSRLKYKVNKSFFKRANTYFTTLDKWLDDATEIINELGMKLEENQKHMHDHIASLIGAETPHD